MQPDSETPDPGPAPPPARQRVHAFVRDGILRGTFAAGSFLEEEQVSAATGVSRTPVREAFQQLHGERLLELVPRRGAMVRVVTVQELIDVYETRLVVESHAVRRLCRDHSPVPPDMLAALAEMRLETPGVAGFDHVQRNTRFHQALVAAAGNAVLTELYDALSARQERVAVTTVRLEPGRAAVILDEHIRIVAALARHDAESAIATLAEHLRPIRDILSQLPQGGA